MARVLLLLLALFVLSFAEAGTPSARTRDTLESLESRVKASPSDFVAWNKLADARLRLLSSTGDLAHLARAAEAVDQSLKTATPEFNHGGLAMRARVELASHRFKEARRDAEQLRVLLPDSAYPLGLLGDALLNLGEYAAVERVWNEMCKIDKSGLDTEPRLAQLDLIYGHVGQARERLAKTLELIRKLQPESPDLVAWCNVQLGEIAFRSGDWETAEKQYEAALSAQPNYYAGLDHLAELRGAQGRLEEAVALYTRLIERLPRPEFIQALGDLYLFAGKIGEAKPWHDRALTAYLGSVEHDEVLYFHHLAGFYADSFNDPEKAVEWAGRDLTLRQSIQAYDALAWALYKTGKIDGARDTIFKALTTGTQDAHILYHAGTILMRVGDIVGGTAKLREALLANPRYNTFHVHR
jgi:tetratricopeptide (TPR) repeat protein